MNSPRKPDQEPHLYSAGSMNLMLALSPVLVMAALLVSALVLFGDDATGGPAQLVLLVSGCFTACIGLARGIRWSELDSAVAHTISLAATPILILLSIGTLIGVWMKAGVIPLMIQLGSQLLNPDIFYLAALLICAVVALVIGSSWTTAGTIGVALIGMATASDLSLPLTAGAIISGAYFGDKLSPLSDTTNLASGLVGANLFVHIQYLLWTTLPAFLIAAVFFTVASMGIDGTANADGLAELNRTLSSYFTISWTLLLPVAALFSMAIAKVPALFAILIAAFIGAVAGALVQTNDNSATDILRNYWAAAATGFEAETGDALADDLLSRGGMKSMLGTVWLIISAMFFSAMLERTGCLARILLSITRIFRRGQSILYGVGLTCATSNVIASDQYLSLVISARMYAAEVESRGLKPEVLSRTMEDFGTVTSPLVPWNTCGAYMAAALGVSTFSYAPFAIFCLVSPLVSLFYIASGISLRWHSEDSVAAG